MINAETDIKEEVSDLMDFVKELRIEKKYLLIFTEMNDFSSLLNKSINYNVGINQPHHQTGNVPGVVTTALCPVIGKRYPEMHKGSCPTSNQRLAGKRLKVSFIGIEPYIKRTRPPSGSEILILEVMAEKMNFSFDLIPARGFDVREINGTKVGMLHRVSFTLTLGIDLKLSPF